MSFRIQYLLIEKVQYLNLPNLCSLCSGVSLAHGENDHVMTSGETLELTCLAQAEIEVHMTRDT